MSGEHNNFSEAHEDAYYRELLARVDNAITETYSDNYSHTRNDSNVAIRCKTFFREIGRCFLMSCSTVYEACISLYNFFARLIKRGMDTVRGGKDRHYDELQIHDMLDTDGARSFYLNYVNEGRSDDDP